MATCALNKILTQEQAVNILRPSLTQILEIVLSLMKLIDHQDIVSCMEFIITKFSKEIGPYALNLINELVNNYYLYRKNADLKAREQKQDHKDDDEMSEDEGDSNMAAQACLETILKIMNSDLPVESYTNLSGIVSGLISSAILNEKDQDLEYIVPMLSKILYKIPFIPDNLLVYYPILCYLWCGKPDPSGLKVDISSLDQGVQAIILSTKNPLFNTPENDSFI